METPVVRQDLCRQQQASSHCSQEGHLADHPSGANRKVVPGHQFGLEAVLDSQIVREAGGRAQDSEGCATKQAHPLHCAHAPMVTRTICRNALLPQQSARTNKEPLSQQEVLQFSSTVAAQEASGVSVPDAKDLRQPTERQSFGDASPRGSKQQMELVAAASQGASPVGEQEAFSPPIPKEGFFPAFVGPQQPSLSSLLPLQLSLSVSSLPELTFSSGTQGMPSVFGMQKLSCKGRRPSGLFPG